MILITITNAKEKLMLVFKVLLLVLLLGLLVPKLYGVLSDAGSLERWAEKEKIIDEPLRVEETQGQENIPFWANVVNSWK